MNIIRNFEFLNKTFITLLVVGASYFSAEGRVFRVVFDDSVSKWGNVGLEYKLFSEDGTRGEDVSTRVEMSSFGGDFKIFEIDAPTFPQHFKFYGSTGSFCEKTFYYSDDWDNDVCFSYNSSGVASVEPRKLFYYEILDRHNWLGSGRAVEKYFFGENGSLFHAWVKNNFVETPVAFHLGESPFSEEGTIHRMALMCEPDKTPWLWLYDGDCPSNAIVAPIHDGALLSHQGELCSKSVYASYRSENIPYDLSGFPVPYSNGEYSVEWILPSQTNTDLFAMVAFTTTPGNNFMAGGLRPTTDLSAARNIVLNTDNGNNHHRFTSAPTDAYCRFVGNANSDPTLEYRYRTTVSEPLRVRASISYDNEGNGDGWMRFTALPVAAVRCSLRQNSTDAHPTTAAILDLSLTSEARNLAFEGKSVADYFGAIRLSSPDPRVEAELARALASKTRSTGAPLITDPEILESLRTTGMASISLPPLRPDLSYQIYCEAVPSDEIPEDGWRNFNFGISEETAADAQSIFKIELPAPTLTATGERFETIILSEEEARSLTTETNRPHGPVEALFTKATRVHNEFSLGGMAEMPEGWTATYRLLSEDGGTIAETTEASTSITGLRPDTPRQLKVQAIYMSPEGNETSSESTWAPSDVFPAGMPSISVSEGQSIVQRSTVSSLPEFGKVYDLVFECNHEAVNPHGIPFYVSIDIQADNASAHSTHLPDGNSQAIRLMSADETYYGNEPGLIIKGNEGLKDISSPEWSEILAKNGRTALYIEHFHCDNQKASVMRRVSAADAEEANVTTKFSVHVPLIMPSHPQTSAKAAERAVDEADNLIVLNNPNPSGSADTATHTIRLTNIDQIATGTTTVEVNTTITANTIHDLHGRLLPSEPTEGFYIKNGHIIRR